MGVCLSVVADVALLYLCNQSSISTCIVTHLLASKHHALLVFHVEFVDLSICLLSTIFKTLVNMTMLY